MSKKSMVGLGIAAFVYVIVLIIVKIPAAWVASTLHSNLPNLWLTGVTGTAWNGVANGAQLDIGDSQIPMGVFRWKVSPWSLVLLNPCMDIKSELAGQPFEGRVCQSLVGNVSVSDLTVDLPVDIFSDMVNLQIGGQASLQVAHAKVAGVIIGVPKVSSLDARLTVLNSSINPGNGWMTLGSYAAVLSESGQGGINAQILDIDAPFGVELTASWVTVGSEDVVANGTIATTPNSPPDAVSAIQIIGEEKEAGVYHIQWP